MDLQTILAQRDEHTIDSDKWNEWDYKKSLALEELKPSLSEEIIAFTEESLTAIPYGLTTDVHLLDINTRYIAGRRSRLEYHPLFRQPIPYAVISHKGKIFATIRTNNGGESRLYGRLSFLGGHVGLRGEARHLFDLLKLELLRELEEEIGLDKENIKAISNIALIKEQGSVESDHLGVVYHIEVVNPDIEVKEKDNLIGQWFTLDELEEANERLEVWAKLIVELLLKKDIESFSKDTKEMEII